MSVNIATGGMYNPCYKSSTGGGGAPPYRRDESVAPKIYVTKFEAKTIDLTKKIFENINVKLIDE